MASTAAENPPRIGLAGCGRWGRNILRDLLSLGCRVSVADPDVAARQHAADAGAASVGDIDALPDTLDGYVVATPTITHYEVVNRLLSQHKPIFCEKPLTDAVDQAEALARRGGERIFVMDKWAYHPGVQALADLIDSGELGPVQNIRTRRLQWGQPHADTDGVWILLPHDLSIIRCLLGRLPETRVVIPDLTDGRLDGVTVVMGQGPTALVEVSARHPQNQRELVVSFAEGCAWLPSPTADHVLIHTRPEDEAAAQAQPISTEFPLLRELRCFRDYLLGGPSPPTGIEQALETVRRIEQVRRLAGVAAA